MVKNGNTQTDGLIQAHGGELIDLILPASAAEDLKSQAAAYPTASLSNRQLCDLELLLNGAYSPLTGFMDQADYQSVLDDMRLGNGLLWPIPVVFDLSHAFVEKHSIVAGSKIALQDGEGFMLAVLEVQSIWQPDKLVEAEVVYGTQSTDHPGVRYLLERTAGTYVGGRVIGLQLPETYVFGGYRRSPAEQRKQLLKKGWRKTIAYQTSRIIHRLHRDMLLKTGKQYRAQILIHPTIGSTKPGDTHYYTRVHCYEAVLKYFPKQIAMLSLMPLSMRMAGARESLWFGIVHQNYGCSHFLVGPNQALPPRHEDDECDYSAQALIKACQAELEIEMIAVEEIQYDEQAQSFAPVSELQAGNRKSLRFSERDIQEKLHYSQAIPAWCSFPEVIKEMQKAYPPRSKQGLTIFFTGLSGSGKSTLAKIVNAQLIESGTRPVTLLDGDIVRLNLSSELGFSKPHRDLNIRRIGFVANEITKNGGVAICAPIAPYAASRRDIRELIEQHGAFIEVHVSTPLVECETRDRKGLYAKARAGLIPEFTGISDPYEAPLSPELNIDTSDLAPLEAAQDIMLYLFQKGFLDQ